MRTFSSVESLTISDLEEAYKANRMTASDGKKHLRAFAEKRGLTDAQALEAFRLAKRLFE